MSKRVQDMHSPDNELRLGLALSGGGARGLAHIGVLQVLERERIRIDCLAGTSMGGVIAAGHARGLSPADMQKVAIESSRLRRLLRLADPALPDAGLMRGQRLEAFFKEILGDITFADLPIPLALVTVDLNSSQEIVLRDGPLALALRATTAVPGFFFPVQIEGMRLVDGGLLNNLPVDAVKSMGADIIIAVDVDRDPQQNSGQPAVKYHWLPDGLARTIVVLDESTRLMMRTIKEVKLQQCPPHFLIRPCLPAGVNLLLGYGRVDELVQAGVRAAEEALPQIQQCIAGKAANEIGLPIDSAFSQADDDIHR
jgi:NTE family protein